MPPKKSPDISPKEVEAEISVLAGENGAASGSNGAASGSGTPSFHSLLEFMEKQDARQVKVLNSLTSSLSAIQSAVLPQQPHRSAACPTRRPPVADLFSVGVFWSLFKYGLFTLDVCFMFLWFFSLLT